MKSLVLIALLIVAGCASSVPALKQYLLRTDVPAQFTVEPSTRVVGLGGLVVAPYIDGPGIVLETSDGEIRAARDHQWAEPLRESIRRFLAREISHQAGQFIRAQSSGENDWQRRIDIRIDELHGTASGDAHLVAYWTIFDIAERKVISEHGFEATQALSVDGYKALVRAEKVLLDKLASAIAASLSC